MMVQSTALLGRACSLRVLSCRLTQTLATGATWGIQY